MRSLVIVAICFTQLAHAYNRNLKTDGGPDEAKLKAFLAKQFKSETVDINGYAGLPIPDGFLGSVERQIKFTVGKAGKKGPIIAEFECAAHLNRKGMLFSIGQCKPSAETSVAELNQFIGRVDGKSFTYDYLDETVVAEDREALYSALKARVGFSNYSCNEGVPSFDFKGSGETLSLVANEDEEFALFSSRTGQESERLATGDGRTLTIYEGGTSHKIEFASFSAAIRNEKGMRQTALGAGVWNRADLVRASELLKPCCEKKKDSCPAEAPKSKATLSAKALGAFR